MAVGQHEKRIPLESLVGGSTLSRILGITSDMTSGHFASGGVALSLQGFTGWLGTVDAAMPVLTITVGTSEPFIPGTSVPLYRVSALLDGGMTVRQVMEEFPSLTAEQILMARDYAQRHPNFGKPYPKKSFKRMLRKSGFHRLRKELADIRGARSVSSR